MSSSKRKKQCLAAKHEPGAADKCVVVPINTTTVTHNHNRTVTILQRSPHHIVALKPPAVVCHHSGWAGSRSHAKTKRGEEPEIPMLQRVRDALHDIGKRAAEEEGSHTSQPPPIRRVNLVHRLDRGASGALLLTYAEDGDTSSIHSEGSESVVGHGEGDTRQLIEAMRSPNSIKTYVALVRGEGVLRGDDLKKKGWFEISRPIKGPNKESEAKDATTLVKFVAGQAETGPERPRLSLVLARPKDGRWHQIRKHLSGISHPILGDSTHGHSKTNGVWKQTRNLPGERIALHLGRLQLVPTDNIPGGIDVAAPLAEDMLAMLRVYAPDVLTQALPVLKEEGILVEAATCEMGEYKIPEVLIESMSAVEDDDGEHVEILAHSEHYVVVRKPPSVVVHNSDWTRKRSDRKGRKQNNLPMLQRVRNQTGRRVNLVHRLDRGASGCLLLTFAETSEKENGDKVSCRVTKSLIESMQNPEATKTYIALCDGDGVWNGVDHLGKGWFAFNKPVKDENGKLVGDTWTDICFVASTILPPIANGGAAATTTTNDNNDNPLEGCKVSIVMARPHTGRWHQIRQHLASGTIGHAILGDSSHGRSRTNRLWKRNRHMLKERTCLHLSRVRLPGTKYSPGGIDVTCPLPPDLAKMLKKMPRDLLDEARPILAKEGIHV